MVVPQDISKEVLTQAGGAQQTTIPIETGREQGFWFSVYNPVA